MNTELLSRLQFMLDQLFPPPILLVILFVPLAIAIGVRFASYLVKQIESAFVVTLDNTEKPKREQPVSFFEPPDEQPDYVVGFGDDGELVYASEKPKRIIEL